MNYDLQFLKNSHKPENKCFPDMPNERMCIWNDEKRKRTRPWDNCWFSNKPEIISLTVEEAINKHPDYILWCYKNLNIKWSVHTIRLIESFMDRPRRMTVNDFMNIKSKLV